MAIKAAAVEPDEGVPSGAFIFEEGSQRARENPLNAKITSFDRADLSITTAFGPWLWINESVWHAPKSGLACESF